MFRHVVLRGGGACSFVRLFAGRGLVFLDACHVVILIFTYIEILGLVLKLVTPS